MGISKLLINYKYVQRFIDNFLIPLYRRMHMHEIYSFPDPHFFHAHSSPKPTACGCVRSVYKLYTSFMLYSGVCAILCQIGLNQFTKLIVKNRNSL